MKHIQNEAEMPFYTITVIEQPTFSETSSVIVPDLTSLQESLSEKAQTVAASLPTDHNGIVNQSLTAQSTHDGETREDETSSLDLQASGTPLPFIHPEDVQPVESHVDGKSVTSTTQSDTRGGVPNDGERENLLIYVTTSTTYGADSRHHSTIMSSPTALEVNFPSNLGDSQHFGHEQVSEAPEIWTTEYLEPHRSSYSSSSSPEGLRQPISWSTANSETRTNEIPAESSEPSTSRSTNYTSHISLPPKPQTVHENGTLTNVEYPQTTWRDSTMENTRSSRVLSRQALGVVLGSISGASLIFAFIF